MTMELNEARELVANRMLWPRVRVSFLSRRRVFCSSSAWRVLRSSASARNCHTAGCRPSHVTKPVRMCDEPVTKSSGCPRLRTGRNRARRVPRGLAGFVFFSETCLSYISRRATEIMRRRTTA